MKPISLRALAGGAVALALGLLLSACLLAPGKFTSALDIRQNGRFTFTYSGEIHFLALSEIAKEGAKRDAEAPFIPQPCTNDAGVERNCSASELDRQKREWEEEKQSAARTRVREAEQMSAMMGGIDLSNPKAAEEFAAGLRRQKGWKSVVHKGKGLFQVEYAIAGTLDHDFVFPAIEGFPVANAFVQLTLREDGSVRIDAPAYTAQAAGGPFKSMAQMMATDASNVEESPQLAQIDGTFTITTDSEILANNTEEGPSADTAGRRLSWSVNDRSGPAPTALIRLPR